MGILIQASGEDEVRVGGHQRACGLYVDGLSVEVDVSQLFESEVVGESEVPRNRPSDISKSEGTGALSESGGIAVMESAGVGGPWTSGRDGDGGVASTVRMGADGAAEPAGGMSRRVTLRVMLRSTMRRSWPSSRGCRSRKTVAKPSVVNSSTHSRMVRSIAPSDKSIGSVVVDELVDWNVCRMSGETLSHRVVAQF